MTNHHVTPHHDNIDKIILAYLLFLLLCGLMMQPIAMLWPGLNAIFHSSGILITDYFAIAHPGAALVNASLTAMLGWGLIQFNRTPWTGLPVAAVFTVFGFALFGKNPVSVLPIVFGTWLYAKVTKQKFSGFVSTTLFAWCLAPLGSYAVLEMGLGLPLGITLNMAAGFLIPALAKRFSGFHKGLNLYNTGFTAGITGMLLMSLLRVFGYQSVTLTLWTKEYTDLMRILCLAVFGSMTVLGTVLSKEKLYRSLLQEEGIGCPDFLGKHGIGTTLLNMGLMGLLGMIALETVQAPYNGPTLGGLFTMAGFGACGKHPKNSLPIMIGILFGSLLYPTVTPGSPGVVLALLFGTTLAPVAGRYGPWIGLLAGMMHLILVTNVGVLHGGLNLYNNGFSGGFTAIIIVTLMQSLKKQADD